MIRRDITNELIESAKYFAAVAILGPRQSGKTTLAQQIFPNHNYVSLEDLDTRQMALNDPRKFLKDQRNSFGIILDEIQHAPELLSYIQTIIDAEKPVGHFIIAGSQNILVNQAVTQTLAGRIAILTLLPLSINELKQANLLPAEIELAAFQGGYPTIYSAQHQPNRLYANYIRSYIERDVRDIKKIFDLNLFQKFLQLCAGRIGQVLNYTSLANDCGIDQKTAQAWISLLQATYVIFLLQPYYRNVSRRLAKSPKLYFVDTGIACNLLNIKSAEELSLHFAKGGIVESFVISDLYKQYHNLGERPNLYFWRDYEGNEIDCVVEKALELFPIEIKAGQTINSDYFKQFDYWQEVIAGPIENNYVVYGGNRNASWSNAQILSWQNIGQLVLSIERKPTKKSDGKQSKN